MHDLFRRLKPLFPEQISRLWVEYELGTPDVQREILEVLTVLAIKHLGMMVGEEQLLLDPPPPGIIGQGTITLGATAYPGMRPTPVRIRQEELLRHLFILGPTGTGKTTLLIGIINQLLHARVPLMIFDFKRNYRCLTRAHDHLVVYTVGRTTAPLHLNALQPPVTMPFPEWAASLADIICTTYLLLQGARNVLMTALLAAYRAKGALATLRDAHDEITIALASARAGSRRYGWLESTKRTLEELTSGGLGATLNATHGTTIPDLLDRAVIFELHGFADDQRRFFAQYFLQAILVLRKNDGAPRETLRHVLVMDEAHNVFPREKFGEQSVPARLAREVREYGEALIAATQQADISESLIANTGFKIILRCDYPKDVHFASTLLQIDAKWLPRLPLGTALARFPVRYYLPFPFTFSAQPQKNTVVPDREIAQSTAQAPRVGTRELLLLGDINTHPISTVTERYARLGWNARTGNTTKDHLLALGLVLLHTITTPSGQVKLLTLTRHAIALLTEAGVRILRERQGGILHEYWKHTIATRLRSTGHVVTVEAPIGGGKTVDVHATRNNEHRWIEIETGRSDVTANATKCAALDGSVVFVFTSTSAREQHAPTVQRIIPRARLLLTTDLHTL